MKRILLTILAIAFLNSATEIHQLAKLPLLLQHFSQHRQEDPSISLLSFLKIHYTATHPDDQDEDRDQELPFKSGDAIAHIDVQIEPARIEVDKIAFQIKIQQPRFPEGIPVKRVYTIFRPPQV